MPREPFDQVLERHREALMALPGVVGTAATLLDGRPCILVMVAQRSALLDRQIPASIEGYAVQVQETGEISAFDEPPR